MLANFIHSTAMLFLNNAKFMKGEGTVRNYYEATIHLPSPLKVSSKQVEFVR